LIKNNKVKENDVVKINYTTDVINGEKEYLMNNNISPTLTTASNNEIAITNNLRIRKLTPRECFRLMGVKDQDFDKVKINQSDSSLYHLAGDSIVVNVLMAIFKQLL
jgi:DNA (cytosine-5)-methyltransferase 1